MKFTKLILQLHCCLLGVSIALAFSVYRSSDGKALQEYNSLDDVLLSRTRGGAAAHLAWGLCVLRTCSRLTAPELDACTARCDRLARPAPPPIADDPATADYNDYTGGDAGGGEDDEDTRSSSSSERTTASRRQIDPLQSCIEAKCANTPAYTDCVYNHCIVGFRLGRLLVSKRLRQTGGGDSGGNEGEERRRGAGDRGAGDIRGGGGDHREQAADDVDRRLPGYTQYVRENSNIERRVVSRKQPTSSAALVGAKESSLALPPPGKTSAGDETVIEQRREYKRSWNDLAGTCVDFHCPGITAGSLAYNVCAQMHCS